MTWFTTSTIRTSLAAGLCAGLLLSGVSLAAVPHTPVAHAAPDAGGLRLDGSDSSLLRAETRDLAPGLQATSFDRIQAEGWVTGDVLIADLTTPTLSVDVRDSGTLTNLAPITEHTLGDHAVAAINGSFFDINNSGAAQGTNISSTDGVRTATQYATQSLTMAQGLAAIQAMSSTSTVDINGVSETVSTVNGISIPENGIGYFTQAWGDYPIARAIGGPNNIDPRFLRVEVANGSVVSVSSDLDRISANDVIPAGRGVLLVRGTAVDKFAGIRPGSALPVTVSTSADVDLSISGNQRLVADGVVVATPVADAPRTAAGVSQDGTKIIIVSLDGRLSHSRGMDLDELGEFMIELGAYNAVNLDGGGSSSLLMREPGSSALSVGNTPSDGILRNIPNSLVFSSTAPVAGAVDVMVQPTIESEDASAVFPGLSRTLRGTGTDANHSAIAVEGEFLVNSEHLSLVSATGTEAVVTGAASGITSVGYQANGLQGSTEVRVLGELNRLQANTPVLALPDGQATSLLQITGIDGDGFRAPIEARDIVVTSGSDVVVTPAGVDSFLVTPQVDLGSATVSFSAGGHRVDVAVTVGLEKETITDLADLDQWKFAHDRSQGTLAPSVGPNGEPAFTLDYDFGMQSGTRGAYAVAPQAIEIPGQPQAITMWVHGDGNGSWPRLQMLTGTGTRINVNGDLIDWVGWKQLTFPVPVGTAFPLQLERVRVMETTAAKQYQGTTSFAGLTAVVAPDVAQPVAPRIFDPVIVTDGTVDERAQRIAVMSDAQFVARNPESPNVDGARQTLREILAAEPELLVINGDFVDEAAPEDYALARQILTEEIGDKLPFVYAPGNHEIMGGPISNFIAEFGPTKTSQVLNGTQIITLNTANGSFNRSDATQLKYLEEQLEAAAADDRITGVLVFAHHPTDDPLSTKNSQLTDRLEAQRFSERLAEFRNDTGKSIAALHAHSGVFHASSADGVSSVLTGNSGKSPSSTPDNGGFTGWAMLGLNPQVGVVGTDPHPVTSRTNWMQAEVKPRVEGLTLGATATLPAVMSVGQTITVDATLLQDDTRVVPVQWPISAQWGGSEIVIDNGATEQQGRSFVTAAETSDAKVLRFNPATGQLTATGEGAATLQLTVNGVTAEHTFTVGPVNPPVQPGTPGDTGTPENPGTPGDVGGSNGVGGNNTAAPSGQNATDEARALAETGGQTALMPWFAAAFAVALGAAAMLFLPRNWRLNRRSGDTA